MEVLERKGRVVAIAAILFIVFWSQCTGVAGLTAPSGHRNATKMSYVCPPQFIRLGHSCYFFSESKSTWQNALFACKDRDSNLSVPARWEDRNLRNYLNKPDIDKASRWIGGIYDYGARAWKWGGELRRMHYQSFSKMKKLSPEELQYHCIAMMPELLYRWSPRSCHEARQYICQTKLKKVPKHKVKEFRRRWQRMGKINEITAPSVSKEVNDPRFNEVTTNPMHNPKSYDLRPRQLTRAKGHVPRSTVRNNPKSYDVRPSELRKRSRPTAQRRLQRPFPGYTWNRRDPEGSYQRNVEILRSGRTGLSPQQVNANLARLQHMKTKQLGRRKRLRDRKDWMNNNNRPALSQTHVKTYTVDNNISALHPKTIVEEFELMAPPPPPEPVPMVRPSRAIG